MYEILKCTPIKVSQTFCWPMTRLIIGLVPYDHPHLSGSHQFSCKKLWLIGDGQQILYSQKFSSGENFRQFHHLCSHWRNFYFLSCINDNVEDIYGDLCCIGKNLYFFNLKLPGLGEIFLQRKILAIQ